MDALVLEVQGIDDFLEILGPEMCGRDWKEGDSIRGVIGSDCGMVLDTWWQQCANIGRNLGSSGSDSRKSH